MLKISCVLLIFLTSLMSRETAAYPPYVLVYKDHHTPLFFVAVFLASLLLLRTRRPATVATRTTRSTTIPPPKCSAGYTLYPGPGRRFCFRFSSDCKTWDEARTACMADNADLIVLDTNSLQPFVDIIGQDLPDTFACPVINTVWLNAKTNNLLVAMYPNGQSIPSDSPLWGEGEPNSPTECITAEISRGSFLLDIACTLSTKYVCQKF